MKNLKKLTILHSNDLHGDFLAEQVDEKLVGGVSRLSGYVNKVRNEDKKLAAKLDPAWGVDVIIGGHSHTYLTEPCEVAGIPIVQAAIGTDQIGRFDIMVDTDTNSIDTYTWQCIPITAENCPRDLALEEVMEKYASITEEAASRTANVLEEYFTRHELLKLDGEPRLIIHE